MYPSQQYSHPCILPLEKKGLSLYIMRESFLLCVALTLMCTVSFRSVVPTTANLPASPELSACGTKCEFGRKTRILPLYKAREEHRVIVVRKPLWHWGNQWRFSSLLCPCSAPGSLCDHVPWAIAISSDISIRDRKAAVSEPSLARPLNSVSSLLLNSFCPRHRCLLELSCRFRLLCQTIIAHKLFDHVVLAFIFLNCITIALERPQIEHRSTVRTITCHPLFSTTSNSGS